MSSGLTSNTIKHAPRIAINIISKIFFITTASLAVRLYIALVFWNALIATRKGNQFLSSHSLLFYLDIIASDPAIGSAFNGTYPQDIAELSHIIMTMWTNFAKSG